MSLSLALCLVSLALVSLVTASESAEEFDALRARAKQLTESSAGKAYDERFSDAPSFAKPLQAALKTCTEQAKPPYAVNLVFAINSDGTLQRIVPHPDQAIAACIAATLEGVKLPEPPTSEWLVALNISIKDPESIQDPGPAMAPTEFVTQVLEPAGGKILRPKDWFYDESHNESSYTWTLSREDTTKGRYATGVRIQTIVGVKKGTGKSPKKFVLDYVAAKKKAADKIVNSCGETNQGMFRRVCLETEEGPFHILYSFFWGKNNLDIVVVSIAGTKKEYWDIYRPTFVEKMGKFELIDLKRFENKKG
jgi:hypothetical protein